MVSRIDDLPLRLIVAISPSSATWVGLGENGSLVGIPAWTLQGEDLPAVQTDDQAVLSEIARQAFRRRGRRAAPIESEGIGGPLLLVAGGADAVWPSVVMAKRLLDRRRHAQVAAVAD